METTADKRIAQILEVLLEYTMFRFDRSIVVGHRQDELDAIAVGINTLGEELAHYIRQNQEDKAVLEQKNKQLEHFTFVTSHDLQEPVRTISNFVDLFEQEYKDSCDAKGMEYLRYIRDASNWMNQMIFDLLQYSRVGISSEKERVDLNQLLLNLRQDLAVLLNENNARLVVGHLPEINGYPNELRLLFQNLIQNAVKFKRPDQDPMVRISHETADGNHIFKVSDNGIGIAHKHYKKIFEIFQRLHSAKDYSGAGIGLAHCRKAVEHHGGEIWVESEVGKGSTFFVSLPG